MIKTWNGEAALCYLVMDKITLLLFCSKSKMNCASVETLRFSRTAQFSRRNVVSGGTKRRILFCYRIEEINNLFPSMGIDRTIRRYDDHM